MHACMHACKGTKTDTYCVGFGFVHSCSILTVPTPSYGRLGLEGSRGIVQYSTSTHTNDPARTAKQ
jgi:hypothetical protein